MSSDAFKRYWIYRDLLYSQFAVGPRELFTWRPNLWFPYIITEADYSLLWIAVNHVDEKSRTRKPNIYFYLGERATRRSSKRYQGILDG